MTTPLFDKGIAHHLVDTIEYQSGAVVSSTLIKQKTGTVTFFAFDSEQELSEHTAPFDAIVLIMEGKADILIAGQSHLLSSGDMIVMPADIPHAVKAIERFKMLLIMIRS